MTTGHFARECQDGGQAGCSGGTWRGSTRRRSRGRAGRGNYSRGRGNFHGQQETSTSEQSGKGASASIVTTHAAYTNETNRSCISEIEWILDSGCSDHIINNEKYFENRIELNEPVNIYIADNRPIKATSIGTVVSYYASGKNNEVKMSNVFYAKEMKANLISYGKLTDNNNTIISKRNFCKNY